MVFCCYCIYGCGRRQQSSLSTLIYMWRSLFLVLLLLPHGSGILPYYNRPMQSTNDVSSAAMQLHWGTGVETECPSLDIRNECDNLRKLENCSVITGFLLISLLPPPDNGTCRYDKYQFPRLREVTDFVIFYDVRHLTAITEMFPSLTVIRGQRLFLNYALSLTNMRDLKVLEFRSLIAIQRGHVLIGRNPKLCNLEKINWNRLTVSFGENHIFPENPEQCLTPSECRGCELSYCWSNQVCQKFENDNILNLLQGTQQCSPLCLGGCLDTTPQTCMVCKGLRDHGTCVEKCPKDKYISDDYLRCYTREECIGAKKLYIYDNKCVRFCPEGYKKNKLTHECELCSASETCIKICNPRKEEDPFWIFSVADVDALRSCQILNSSVFILLRNRIQENYLIDGFAKITDIKGHLKIYKSPYLTNLKFLKNLRKIHGQPMESEQYSLILYHNQRIQELWPLQEGFELVRGGIYVHSNDKLCNRVIVDFASKVIHDKSKDSLQSSDQEVLCAPTRLYLNVQVLSHRSIKFIWPKNQTSDQVELIYRSVLNGTTFDEDSELDTPICDRIKWRRVLKFSKELSQNATHYFYTVTGLQAFTKYACLIKTFGGEDYYEGRSNLLYFTTQADVPASPPITIKRITENALTLQLDNDKNQGNIVYYYIVEVYDLPEQQAIVDRRDYCKEPFKTYSEIVTYEEDYDDCCMRQHEENEDNWFQRMMKEFYTCSRDRPEYCSPEKEESEEKPTLVKRFTHGETSYTMKLLERLRSFRLFVIQAKACNYFGCSSFAMLTQRTNSSTIADNLYDLSGCRVANTNEYRIHFNEPQHPNSLIISYIVHLRWDVPFKEGYQTYIRCLTRLEHEQDHYMFKVNLSNTYSQVAVRVNSLAGHIFNDWVNITSCDVTPMDTKLAGAALAIQSSKGWNMFLVCFLLGAGGTMLWICYKRRYWRHIIELKRYLHMCHMKVYIFMRRRDSTLPEDRRVLVDAVQFQNVPQDEMIHLVN